MVEEKSLFERLDDISAGQSAILNEITGVKTQVSDTDSKITELEQEIQKLKSRPVIQPKPSTNTQPKSDKEILQVFLKQSKKSWRWFGTRAEFNKWKILAIISLVTLLLVGLITSIVSSICFQMYSTFTFFENAWMICGIIYLVYATKTQLTYEVNALASSSPTKYERDNLGMMFPRKEKLVFRIFKWLAIISTVCNIICVWAGMVVKEVKQLCFLFFEQTKS
ncbi:MAG: hypothetical protein PHT30_01310 [Bacilli bacterium]|nr:hypothetical protein [Bacilli bacterium]